MTGEAIRRGAGASAPRARRPQKILLERKPSQKSSQKILLERKPSQKASQKIFQKVKPQQTFQEGQTFSGLQMFATQTYDENSSSANVCYLQLDCVELCQLQNEIQIMI